MNQAYNMRGHKSRQQKASTGLLGVNSNDPTTQNTLEYLQMNNSKNPHKTRDPLRMQPDVSAPSFPPGYEETQLFLQRNSLGMSHS
mmetsp:Transcript_33635/g.51873  ORF Transcript_33635/g.51873 Transcript_33635/m.51873 type:complete len:86 (+) Transcript_33635:1578-1835(+)